jgi:hypothetical protein
VLLSGFSGLFQDTVFDISWFLDAGDCSVVFVDVMVIGPVVVLML